ncbi:unnamed protein product [Brassica oleracea var. botrytis]|uniref:BnaUnng00510D protein n=2 Tax=Brassica TaxID=3705 RepID=A0A078GQN8_BRANA|nr:BnaUnng00510D [Brassica napus]VDD12089.1 unnamed protein product [Brassica oleracea]
MGLKGFAEGGIASIVVGCSTHPLDLIKVRMQLQGESASIQTNLRPALAFQTSSAVHAPSPPPRVGIITIGSRIIRQEGTHALFSGVSATVLRQTLYSMTLMGLYDILKTKWTDPETKTIPTAAPIPPSMNPADVAMVRVQADGRLPVVDRRNYKSVLDAIAQMVRGEGVTLLWRGSSMTINRAMLVTASQLATYDSVKETILEKGLMRDGLGTHVTSSFTAGFVASVASNPVDVIKTRVMNMKVEAGKTAPYKGAVDCALKTVRAEGIMALYKGFLPTVSRQAPFTMIMPVVLIYFNQSSTMSSSAATVAQKSVSSSTFDDLSLGPTSQVVAGRILCFWD